MSIHNIMENYVFTSKYARWDKEKKRRETWHEAVTRVENMMLKQYEDYPEVHPYINHAYDFMKKKRILGSQRVLQYGGEPIFKKNTRTFNCCFSYADRPRFFQEYFWLLLCGCGAGFSVQKHHVNKLPKLQISIMSNTKTFIVEDTIEGWADALGALMTNAFGVQEGMEEFKEYGPDKCGKLVFDFSKIRPKGSPLSSGVGKAPGPDGLKAALIRIQTLLDDCSSRGKLRPIDVYDICMHASDAVLSGGVRRSATICLFSPDDKEMATAKTGNWFVDNPQRGRSNNSAVLVRKQTSFKEFQKLIDSVKEYGEPGFVWVESPEHGMNPCAEISFFAYYPIDPEKFNKWKKDHAYEAIKCKPEKIGLKSCWHFCNLSTVNCSKLKGETFEEKKVYFLENVEATTIVGTLQAGFTNFSYLEESSQKLCELESLLGVSMTGMMDNFEVVLSPEVQQEAAKLVLATNAKIAKLIGINPCARATCIKPEGTGTLVLGSTSHGIHANHHVRFLRAIQANRDEIPYQLFKQENPKACERSKWDANNTDDIIFFPLEVPDGAKTKNQIPAIELLKIVKSTQQNWVKKGKRKNRCLMPWLEHNVSNTITVYPEEWQDVTKFIYTNRDYFCGISLVPGSVDKDYPQAPNCAVFTSRQIVREYGDAALWTSGLIELALMSFPDLWDACSALLDDDFDPSSNITFDPSSNITKSDVAEIFTRAGLQKRFWLQARRFADKYFDGDYKRLNYCMKDVYNWKKWTDLRKSLKQVDYKQIVENEDNTKIQETIACAGGSCTI